MAQTTGKRQILFKHLRSAMNWRKHDDAPITPSAHSLGRGLNAEEGADDESLSASAANLMEALAAEARHAVLHVLEDGVDEKEAAESILKISVQIMQRSGSKLAWLDVGTITDAALDLAYEVFEEQEVIGMAFHVMESCSLEMGLNRKLRPEVYALVHSMQLLQGPHGRLQAQKTYSVQSQKSVGGKECEAAELICQAGVFILTLAAAPQEALSAPLNLRHLLLFETRLQSLCLHSVTASLCPPTTSNPTLLFVPVGRVALLKEQEPHLAHVKRVLSGEAHRGPAVVSLVGRAGSGKTQVALALALSEPYAAVLWIDASPYALEASVRRVCNALGLKGRPGELAAVLKLKLREHLESCPTWLVVLDNVETGSDTSGLMPIAGSCHFLITTQTKGCGVGVLLNVDHMSVRDAAKCLGEGTAVDAEELELLPSLAVEVDGLPLALCALKCMLRSGHLPSILLRRLRARSRPPTKAVIEEHPRSLFSNPSSLREALDGWVELVGVDTKAPSALLASAMVEVCGFFGPTSVPPPLLALAANTVIRGKLPPDEVVAAACRSLVDLGLASEQRETGHLIFYPLLQEYSRHRSQAADASLAALTALSATVCTRETYPHCLAMWGWRSSLDLRKECAALLPVLCMRLMEYFFQGLCPKQAVPFCGQVLLRYTPTSKRSTKLYISAKCLLADLLVSELSDREGAVSELKAIPRQIKDGQKKEPLGLLAAALLLAFSAVRAPAVKDIEEEVREVEGKIEAMGESRCGKDGGGVYKPEALYLVMALSRLATLLKGHGKEAWLERAAEIQDKTLGLCDWALPPGTPLTLHSCRLAGGMYFHRFLLRYRRVHMLTHGDTLPEEEAAPRRRDTRGQGTSMGQGEWVKDLFTTFPPFPKPSPATLPLPSPAEEAEEQRRACRVFKFLILNTQRSRALWGEQTADPLLEAADLACWALLCPLSAASVALMEAAGGRLTEYLNKMGVERDRDGLPWTKKEKFTVQSCLALIRLQSSRWREEIGAKV